jgi:hypothetical protein
MFGRRRKIKRIIEGYKKELEVLGIHPEKIVLYGSYAKNNPRKESDIDIIVISSDFKKFNFRERLEILGVAAGRVFEPIEALGYTPEEIGKQEEGSFVKEILDFHSIAY